MDYTEAMKRAKELPRDSNNPIYQDLNGNRIKMSYFICYQETKPTPETFFLQTNCTRLRADGGWYQLIRSKTDENGKILPHKIYRNYVIFRKKYARNHIVVTGVSYDIVGLKRRSTHLPPAVLLANIQFIKPMTPEEERAAIREILAKNRYAKCPDNFNKRRFAAIRADMECRYMTEWLATPSGLYTDSQIWSQCFNKN